MPDTQKLSRGSEDDNSDSSSIQDKNDMVENKILVNKKSNMSNVSRKSTQLYDRMEKELMANSIEAGEEIIEINN